MVCAYNRQSGTLLIIGPLSPNHNELSYCIALHCIGLCVAFIIAAMSAWSHVSTEVFVILFSDVVCLGISFLRNIVRRRIAYKFTSWRNCSVLLILLRWRPWSRATGAKSPKSTHSLWLGFTEPGRCNTETYIALHRATSRTA